MPHLIDRAQRLSGRPAVAQLLEERCLPERDLLSTCARCAEHCPAQAIDMGFRQRAAAGPAEAFGPVRKEGPAGPCIDDEACLRCGRCITACPTAALRANPPFDDGALLLQAARIGKAAQAAGSAQGGGAEAARRAAQGSPEGGGGAAADDGGGAAADAVFACERAARRERFDAGRTAVLPCLAWVDEALLVHAAFCGARRVAVYVGACPSCDARSALDELGQVVSTAQRILDIWQTGARARVVGEEGFADEPDSLRPPAEGADGFLSRRGLLAQGRAGLAAAAAEAASARFAMLAQDAPGPPAGKADARRWQLLDDLHAFGLPPGDVVVPRRLAPRVDIEASRCSGCALCAEFCPTGALRKAGKAASGRSVLEFDAARCRDCGVCTKTCRYRAVSCEERLSVAELFSLAPRSIVIPKRRVLPTRP